MEYKRSELKECAARSQASSIYDKLSHSDIYLVNGQLEPYKNGDRDRAGTGGGAYGGFLCVCVIRRC